MEHDALPLDVLVKRKNCGTIRIKGPIFNQRRYDHLIIHKEVRGNFSKLPIHPCKLFPRRIDEEQDIQIRILPRVPARIGAKQYRIHRFTGKQTGDTISSVLNDPADISTTPHSDHLPDIMPVTYYLLLVPCPHIAAYISNIAM